LSPVVVSWTRGYWQDKLFDVGSVKLENRAFYLHHRQHYACIENTVASLRGIMVLPVLSPTIALVKG